MKLLQVLKSFLTNKSAEKIVPEGYCPNCWGRQEYGGQLYEAVLNEGITAENLSDKIGWVEAYAQKHLLGIKLAKSSNDELVCAICKVGYKPTDT